MRRSCEKWIKEKEMSKKSLAVSGLGLGLGMLTLADEVRRAIGITDE